MENVKENALKVIEKLDTKDFGIYFFTLDTKGNATAGVANIYEHAKQLIDLGYKAYILHEEVEYTGVGDWLGKEYAAIPHVAIKAQNHSIGASDFIVIPEVFANILEKWNNLPAKKIVMSQSYDYILELLNVGASWGQYGVTDVITTTDAQAKYIKSLFPSVKTHIVPVAIPEYFKASDKPKKPIVSLLARDQRDVLKIAKAFYLQYPMYKWVTFRELRGMTRKSFAKAIGESCLSVWVDDISSFGTFPIESIECDTPVIGVIPDMVPEWMIGETSEDGGSKLRNNGVWVNSVLQIPEVISQYLKVWLEDAVPQDILEAMKETKGKYTVSKQTESIAKVYGELVEKRKIEIKAIAKLD